MLENLPRGVGRCWERFEADIGKVANGEALYTIGNETLVNTGQDQNQTRRKQ